MTWKIVPATEPLIAEIETWLDAEEVNFQRALQEWREADYGGDEPIRGFRCNWDSVKKRWREGVSKLHVLVSNNAAVGFLDGTDILEVRPDLRGKGYGRILATFMVQSASEEGRSVIEIEIAPHSAEPFWRYMDFTPVYDRRGYGGGTYAYRVLPRRFELGEGVRVQYVISFLSEAARYSEHPEPFSHFSGQGERLDDGRIQLSDRVFCFNPLDSQHVDYFLKVEVNGHLVHFDKVGSSASKLCGVRRDAGYHFYIECIDIRYGHIPR